MKAKDLLKELRLCSGLSDPWGESMGLWFDIAAELHWRGDIVPWDYSPGCSDDPRDHDSYFYGTLQEMDTEVLIKAGNVLERFTGFLRKSGKDY